MDESCHNNNTFEPGVFFPAVFLPFIKPLIAIFNH
jgi:hypothetical protein